MAAPGWQTAGVVFVADALGGWLVGRLADAGRKKLTELVLGSEQERALRRTADAAVWATAQEMSPSGGCEATPKWQWKAREKVTAATDKLAVDGAA